MSDKRNTDEKLAPLLEYLAERLNRVFAHYLCVFEFDEDEDLTAGNDRSWALQTIQNACLHETLLAVRDLDDFFRNRGVRADDLHARAFGYTETEVILTDEERTLINKLVAHTTTRGPAGQAHPWPVYAMTNRSVEVSTRFLSWIEQQYGLGHFMLFTAALGCRQKTGAIWAAIKRKVSADVDGLKPTS